MVARSHVIFDRAPTALTVVAVIGTITAFYAATIGIAQTDIKKVLAYSTISQLGYMFLACGVAAYSAGIFHLMTHAFFKGLLFLAAGSVIHAVGGEQDMRRMGGLRTKIPVTFWTMTAGTFAIAGFPPLAGFFSKDEILWQASRVNMALWGIGELTAFLTSFYMFRLWFLTFFGEYRGAAGEAHAHAEHAGHGTHLGRNDVSPGALPHGHEHGGIHESPKIMLIPLVILAILSVAGGWVNIGKNFEKFLEPAFRTGATAYTLTEAATQATKAVGEQGSTELLFTLTSVLAAVLGLLLAWLLYKSRPDLPRKIADALNGLYTAVLNKYYVDELYAVLFIKPLIAASRSLWLRVDQGLIDGTVNDIADAVRHASDNIRHMQSGNIRSYAGWIALGAALVIAYMIWVALP
jgi:NADH-quinone oxidoreductase subunit L